MCDSCNVLTDPPAIDNERWIAVETKSPGSRPMLWVKTASGEVHAASNDGQTATVEGSAIEFTHWMLRS